MSSKLNKLEIKINSPFQNDPQPKRPNFDDPALSLRKEKCQKKILSQMLKKLYYYGISGSTYKIIMDTIYNGILLTINVVSLTIIIINSAIRSKIAKSSGVGNSNYEYNFTQALIKFIVNAITYVIAFLIIYRALSGSDLTDFVYLIGCLIVEVAYCFNRAVIREICKICCCKIYEEDQEGILAPLRTNTFGNEEDFSSIGGDTD